MVSLRLITFVSLFMIILIRTQGGMSKVELAADETGQPRRNPVNVEKEIYDGVDPSAVAEILVHQLRIGRKMIMSKRILGMVKEEGTLNNIKGERRLKNIRGGHRGRVKVKIAGFIPLNADYHVPKPHPPKNN